MQARRKAQQVRKARMVEAAARAQGIEQALTGFFAAQLAAEDAREAARAKADRALADGEDKAHALQQRAAGFVAALAQLGESRSQISEVTQLSISQVRSAIDTATKPPAVAVAWTP